MPSRGNCARLSRAALPGPVPSPPAPSWPRRSAAPRHPLCPPPRADPPEPDFAERLFGSIFGQKSLADREPFGLKRLTAEGTPELYPAVTDEWADAVDGDGPDVAVIRPMLARTQLEKKALRCAYDANRDGWTASAFHDRLNTFGAAVVVATTEGGSVIGGYNPSGWIGIGENRDSIAAFLFTFPDGDTTKRPIKLPKVGGAALAVIDKPSYGIQFGAEGLKIPLNGVERIAKCRLGTYYARTPDGGRTLFSGSEASEKEAVLTDLKVFVAEGEGEEWELDGITWKTNWKG
ncbi:unnamed protein product [Ostreobium quekettii]|uniref:TLDc domain-containing protein n=1 Tax=Ostreobium quekettii TaxID=121088 RepID=A0A8S1J1A1_9CHLO|nr:unnamed protein product [Ostreobium quekettii]